MTRRIDSEIYIDSLAYLSFDLTTEFVHVAPKTRIYYRVGVRNTMDTPGPLNDKEATPNGGNYLYSAAASYEVADSMP